MDGIDAALVETDGEGVVNPIACMFFPYEPDFRPRLRAAMARALEMHAPARDALIDAVEQESTGLHAMAVHRLLAATHTLEEMRAFIGCDSLSFLSLDGIYRAVGEEARNPDQPQYTDHCFTGDYPTGLTDLAVKSPKQLSLLAEAS